MSKHVMLDIETFSTKKTASIISIGAVKFDPDDKHASWDSFHVAIDPAQFEPAVPFDLNLNTVVWWMSPERTIAREHWLRSVKLDLPSALVGFCEWYGTEPLPTWGNGATFDLVIMENALRVCGEQVPWGFCDERCFRTLRAEWPSIKRPSDQDMVGLVDAAIIPEIAGVAHTALYDAQQQALHLVRIYEAKRVGTRFSSALADAGRRNLTTASPIRELDEEAKRIIDIADSFDGQAS